MMESAAVISGIQISGRGFTEPTNLTFFTATNQRISVVFGRNGSGKTTVGDGFARFAFASSNSFELSDDDDLCASLLIGGQAEKLLPDQVDAKTLVFNERFTEQKVRIADDGIRSLVLFGSAGESQDDLDAAIVAKEEARQRLEASGRSHETATNELARQRSLAMEDLRSGWADREREIKGNRQNSPVKESLLDELIGAPKPAKLLSDAKSELAGLKEQLVRSRGGETISVGVPQIDVVELLKGFRHQIFQKLIEPVTGAGLAGLVAKTLEEHGLYVQQAQEFFVDTGVSTCPFCQQEVSPLHRAELLDAIESAVDQPAKDFLKELEASKLSDLRIHVDQEFVELDPVKTGSIKRMVELYNSTVERWNREIEGKKTNLYAPVNVDFSEVSSLLEELDEELVALSEEVARWNLAVRDFKRFSNDASKLNKVVSRLELDARISDCVAATQAQKLAAEEAKTAATDFRESEKVVIDLKGAMKREDVAADQINRNLSIVFADSSRLRLVPGDAEVGGGKFYLQSRGRDVRPNRLSVGERNVLALCYFFTLLNQSLDDGFDPDYALLVLDDPISSVDTDCRIGILGFLETQIGAWLGRSERAKVLFLTHDVGVYQDLGKTSNAVLRTLKPRAQGDWGASSWVMRNSGTESSNSIRLLKQTGGFGEPLHEYKTLLSFVFEYAQNDTSLPDSDVTSIGVGNALRRVFEAFGVFIYNQDSITASTIEDAYVALGNEPLIPPLRQSLVTVLHGGSHNKDRMLMLGDFTAGSVVDHKEKVQAVRRILALMNALQPQHMERYLSGEAADLLKQWEMELL